jgi:hypothetical protein
VGDDAIMLLAWLISCSSILKEYAKVEFEDDLRHQRKRITDNPIAGSSILLPTGLTPMQVIAEPMSKIYPLRTVPFRSIRHGF